MNGHRRLLTRPWMLPVAIGVLIAGHVLLPYAVVHATVAASVVSTVIALIVLTHLGVLAMVIGPLYARFRRRSPH